MAKPLEKLSPELVQLLQGEKIVSLITTDKESNKPQLSIVSWLVANQNGTQIKFALGHKASSAENIMQNPEVILGAIGADSCYAIHGKASVSEIIEKTMKLRVVTVDVESVEDVIFYGGKVTTEPAYEKTYDAELAKKLDEEVYELLRQ